MDASMQEPSSGSSKPADKPDASEPVAKGGGRKVTRRNPEKRRIQNVQAARKYRERYKKRVQELEAFCASASPVVHFGTDNTSSSSQESHGHAQFIQGTDTLEHGVVQLPVGLQASAVIPRQSTPSALISPAPEASDVFLLDQGVWTTEMQYQQLIVGRWYKAFLECGCLLPHAQFRRPPAVNSSDSTTYSGRAMRILQSMSILPDMMANHLRLEPVCLIEAMRANCLQVGITEDMFCSDDSVSPFFRPGCVISSENYLQIPDTSPTADARETDSLVRSVQGIFHVLKPDLRPLRDQITTPHHPYIDILPFPTIRTQLIQRGATIDEDEFFHDLLVGLVCWGGAGTSGRRDRREAGAAIGSGTPWDVRSWEASEWFLQKYWTIVGGEDGELTRQSRWWRSIRGVDESGDMIC